MNLLLDTHTFLWFLEGSQNLSSSAKTAIQNQNNTSFISIASIWEIAIKLGLGKLKLDTGLDELKSEILKNGFEILPLDFEHIF
ncbi:type II toxin-antitoxin system VapC family toxin [Algoriphagus sp.]|jgi:PIN domain nuclease of toxin-antitoxin system|uniref:type II toxin-antitoxin system VapC family toxin n=1 Tax=Algoriphagus sp. TaxID=1872435 RepID=UPI00271C8B34|nr:type II toxin-antitoxin system VapC family toxin [Algoriphagus sp.]MDO8968309.1 type II toxin-antitoxin system VapC family toxin [Algoriphagus sp.]MDP3200104.1 type II toxin-antitoxin system VapC family toxin [Algoriphagus sp.]